METVKIKIDASLNAFETARQLLSISKDKIIELMPQITFSTEYISEVPDDNELETEAMDLETKIAEAFQKIKLEIELVRGLLLDQGYKVIA